MFPSSEITGTSPFGRSRNFEACRNRMTPAERVQYWVREKTPPSRRTHQEGIVQAAGELAGRFHLDAARLTLAAWLHDAGKYLPPAVQQTHLAGRNEVEGIAVDAEERAIPELWHAPVSALFGRQVMGVDDAEVLRACRLHTTGAPGMTTFELALYVVDYIEPSRAHDCRTARKAARSDLRRAALETVRGKIAYLRGAGRPIHPRSIAFEAELAGAGVGK